MIDAIAVEVVSSDGDQPREFDYDAMISDPWARERAESAAGFITFGLGQAVMKVLEAGARLSEMKSILPHGEYLPWVEQACGLKPKYAAQLIKTFEWMSNVQHAGHLDQVTDVTTLFLLSADTTTEEVRQWFTERAQAGDVPTRAELRERKRQASSPRQPRPAEALAVGLIRKGADEVQRLREALALAERAAIVSADAVMDEQRLRQLPKGSTIYGATADFHRLRDGQWIRLPHEGVADAVAVVVEDGERSAPRRQQMQIQLQQTTATDSVILSRSEASKLIGVTPGRLSTCVSKAKREGAACVVRGHRVEAVSRGRFRVTTPTPPHSPTT